ncbi:MAG: endonuclease NucS [Desulfurococcales archaeon]|nr:endonuclease NucS [Desulfurococcales archaeon]
MATLRRALVEPPLEDAARALQGLLTAHRWVVLWGRCRADYEGRGASSSGEGDVLVVVKEDRSVIVHGPRGFRPLNWQPSGAAVTASMREGLLELRAVRKSPRETLTLTCSRVYLLSGLEGAVEPEFHMYLSEAEIRDILASNPSLIEEGLRIVGVERPVDPGFVDMYGIDREGRLVVFEIKRVKAGESAARQLLRYVETLRSRGHARVRGVLLAPDFTESAIRLLEASGLEHARIDPRAIYEMAGRRRSVKRVRGLTEYLGKGSAPGRG